MNKLIGLRLIGDIPGMRFSARRSPSVLSQIRRARRALSDGRIALAKDILAPLAVEKNAEAIYLIACVSSADESERTFARRHIRQLAQAANKGFAPALFALGVYFDTGENVVRDKKRAARLFGEAAKLGHPHAQWIHAMDLMYGRNGIGRNIRLGRAYLEKSLAAKFVGAIRTTASLYENGECGFPKDRSKAQRVLRLLRRHDLIEM